MNSGKLIILGALAAVSLLSGCKKDDETAESVYLQGTLTLDHKLPAFTEAGIEHTFIPSKVTRKDDDKSTDCTGYLFYTSLNQAKDTTRFEGDDPGKDGAWTVTIPKDYLGSFTVYCVAFAKGYSNKSVSTSTVVVDPRIDGKGSLTGIDFSEAPVMNDNSGNTYPYTTAGGVDWMMQNLADGSCGQAYKGVGVMSGIYGRYYTWEEAVSVCPDGWALPSSEDWDNLAGEQGGPSIMADVYFNGAKMWEYWPGVSITNTTGLSVLPAGYAMLSSAGYSFTGLCDYAMFWTSDESDADFAVARYIYENNSTIFAGLYDKKGIAASVRCIRK